MAVLNSLFLLLLLLVLLLVSVVVLLCEAAGVGLVWMVGSGVGEEVVFEPEVM